LTRKGDEMQYVRVVYRDTDRHFGLYEGENVDIDAIGNILISRSNDHRAYLVIAAGIWEMAEIVEIPDKKG
jgi:hypothetical protein